MNSVDQTTRIHGPMPTPSTEPAWHEISRPQVHGYDLVGVQFIDALTFVSVADEKVARVFEAPRAFVQLVNSLQVARLNVDEGSLSVQDCKLYCDIRTGFLLHRPPDLWEQAFHLWDYQTKLSVKVSISS